MKNTLASIVVAVSIAAGIAQASAAPITFTYKGTVSYGQDLGGFFGTAGADLAGKSFAFVQTIDVAQAAAAYASPYYTASSGTGGYASSKLQIDGSAFCDILGGTTYTYSSDGAHVSWLDIDRTGQVGSVSTSEYTYAGFVAIAPSLTADDQPTTITFDHPVYGGYFSTYQAENDPSAWTYSSRTANASFELQSLSIASMSAVPLPASAPMFGAALLALGTFGYGVKRKKAAIVG